MKQKSMFISLIVILSLLLAGIQPAIPVTAAAVQDDGGIPGTPGEGLDGAVTPLAYSCTTGTPVSSRISTSSDDAEESSSSGAVTLTNTTLQTYRVPTRQWWGMRFQAVNVPQGAIITSATVTFRAAGTNATASSMTLWGQLAANPTTFTTGTNNISSTTTRPHTSASIAWSIPSWTTGNDYESADIITIVQEIVNQSGWTANNSMVIIGQATANQNKTAISRDNGSGSTLAPLLRICYSGAITTSISTLSGFYTLVSTPSIAQTYTVAGTGLTNNLVITPPAGFEVSTDGTTYSSSLTLTQSGGTVGTTTIYVRLTGVALGTYSGDITHASSGATLRVAVSGWVVSALCGSVSSEAVDDAYIRDDNATNNYGITTTLRVTSGTTNQRSSLLRWNLSFIPTTALISSASVTLNVTQAGSQVYNLYNLRRNWLEGTGNGSATGDGATWNTYDGVNSWGIAGASNTTSDREDTTLWNATASSFNATGSRSVALNASGITVVQGWIAGTTNNFGVILQNYSGTNNEMRFASAENALAAATLTISYCLRDPNPTAVTLASFSQGSLTNGVQLDWSTATEVGLLGFNLYRADVLEGVKQQLNLDLIPALTPGDLMGNAYQFADGTAISGQTYQYWIELVMLDGNQLSDPLTILVPYWIRLPLVIR
jgi:hypothetical protein